MQPLSKLYTNSHYPLTLIYKDKDGNPIDITGYTSKLVLRPSLSSNSVVTKTATIDGPNGKISFVIEPTDTVGILGEDFSSKFLIGATLTNTDGHVLTLLQTSVEVVENIVPAGDD
ncbi:hypothetical protein [Alteromonas sp. BMJM2]|uniref:hypothetical protein n=1 Tax=Alteromonas sp. BMJM2 TaxID=2954241 RepID=UPI0022B3D802|nr:hypothetical protein [Alteromonas sp. BMJM2]